MSKSKPPPARVDLVSSYARSNGSDVELSLAHPAGTLPSDAVVILRRGKTRRSAAPAIVPGSEAVAMVARFPRASLTKGVWVVRLRMHDRTVHLGCRLLVQGARPPVLLWGAEAPPARLPRPRARPTRGRIRGTAPAPVRRAVGTIRRRLARRP